MRAIFYRGNWRFAVGGSQWVALGCWFEIGWWLVVCGGRQLVVRGRLVALVRTTNHQPPTTNRLGRRPIRPAELQEDLLQLFGAHEGVGF
jgi:hypothetical protein